jgi:hypothetical protein
MGQCWWRIFREIKVFSRFEYYIFYVLYPFVTYLLTPPPTLGQIVADVPGELIVSLTPPQESKKKLDGVSSGLVSVK